MIIASSGAFMIRTITVAALCTVAPLGYAQDVTGEWAGRYICNQGVTELHLTIQKTGAGKGITATFNFGPPPENPDVPKGAYAMRGTYDPATRRLKLEGERWLKQPSAISWSDWTGRLRRPAKRSPATSPIFSAARISKFAAQPR